MNITSIITALTSLIPAVLALLNDPQFQAVVKAVEGLLNQQVAAGVPTATASQQAAGLLTSAAMLHLTGNPVTDFNAWVASLKPSAVKVGPILNQPAVVGFTS
jgi:hypothetical protein